METALEQSAMSLKPLEIVLLRTGRDAFYGQSDYPPGLRVTPEATRWLYERGVRVMGIDAWGWDGPLAGQAKMRWPAGAGLFWAAHQSTCLTRRSSGWSTWAHYPPLDSMACFPLKMKGGSVGRPAPWRSFPIRETSIFAGNRLDDGSPSFSLATVGFMQRGLC